VAELPRKKEAAKSTNAITNGVGDLCLRGVADSGIALMRFGLQSGRPKSVG